MDQAFRARKRLDCASDNVQADKQRMADVLTPHCARIDRVSNDNLPVYGTEGRGITPTAKS